MFSSSKEHCIVAFSWSASSLKFNQLTVDNEPALDTIGWMQGLLWKVYSPIRYLYRLFQNKIFSIHSFIVQLLTLNLCCMTPTFSLLLKIFVVSIFSGAPDQIQCLFEK